MFRNSAQGWNHATRTILTGIYTLARFLEAADGLSSLSRPLPDSDIWGGEFSIPRRCACRPVFEEVIIVVTLLAELTNTE